MNKRTEIEKKLAQCFIIGAKGQELSDDTADFLREYGPGGFIYFAHNYESPQLLAEMSDKIQETKANPWELPLFVGVDHEGGRVQRFRKQFTCFPEPAEIGSIESPKLAFLVAEVMARELAVVGVNLNFHPLCDIHTRPSNPVIGKRSFGTAPEIVSKMSSAMVRGFMSQKVVSCVKHFPGHGDTTVDSHFDLPKLDFSWPELLERELKPFIRAIKSKVDMIMTAHILNSAIDPELPATLSAKTIKGKLRDELRFSKLVITDDMQMEAVTKHFGEEEMVALALNAGCDLLLYRDEDRGRRAMDAAFRFLSQGKISPETVQESFLRIKEVKERMLMPHQPCAMDQIAKVVGCEAHKEVLRMVEQRKKPAGPDPAL